MDKITETLTGVKARNKMLSGVNKVYDVVKLTLGPEGKNALLPRSFNRGPRITNDGVTISENIRLRDEHERLAADAFKEGSKKTNELAGDGTTTTAVIGGHLINTLVRNLHLSDVATIGGENKKGTRAIRKELKEAKDLVIAKIKEKGTKVEALEELEKIAIVSIGKEDEGVARHVAKLVWDIGVDNHVDVVEGYKGQVEIEKIEGMRLPAKVCGKAFVTHPEKYEMVVEDTPVIITNYKLESAAQLVGALTPLKLSKAVIFAPDFSEDVLVAMVLSRKQNGVFIYPVKCPALRTEQLEDLAVYTGATLIDKNTGKKFSSITPSDLGAAEKIIVKDTEAKEDAVILGGKGLLGKIMKEDETVSPIQERINILKGQIKESRNELTTISLQKRIANLSSAIGIIRVGASTSKESLYLKLKIEDGVFACKAALEEGYVKGGGQCLKEIAEELPINILTETLKAPYAQIQTNSGGDLEIGDEIIDPVKVVRLAVEHGVSVAATMITCDIIIPEVDDKSPGEGYADIAKAIGRYATLWGKQQGLIKQSADEEEADRNFAFENVMLSDKD